jgi:putative ABC transport system permease protein
MREEGSGMAVERVGRLRVVAGVAVTVLGGAVLALGLARYAGALVGGGGLLFLVGVAVLAVPITRPLARLIGAPVARLAGMPGWLGRANATRSPRRTAATASALMIGLAMIVTMTVVAASQKATAGAEVRTLGAPYQLATGDQPAGTDPFGTPDGPVLSRALLDELASRPGVSGVTGRWGLAATLATPPGWKGAAPAVSVDAVYDPASYQRIAGLRLEEGTMDGRGFAVSYRFADGLGVAPGSRLWVEVAGAAAPGTPIVLPVTGVFSDPQRRASPVVVALDRVAAALPADGVPVAYVAVDGGQGPAAAAALASATSAYPAVTVRDGAGQRRFQEQQVNRILSARGRPAPRACLAVLPARVIDS